MASERSRVWTRSTVSFKLGGAILKLEYIVNNGRYKSKLSKKYFHYLPYIAKAGAKLSDGIFVFFGTSKKLTRLQ